MDDDLIEQLRKIERAGDIPPKGHPGLAKRAADEIESLRRDIASRDGGLGSLYSIREALGFNKLYPLSHLDGDARQMRAALLACAPIAHAAIAEEKKNEIGNSDLDNEQPVAVTIRTTLGVIREARRALFVANIHAPAFSKGER